MLNYRVILFYNFIYENITHFRYLIHILTNTSTHNFVLYLNVHWKYLNMCIQIPVYKLVSMTFVVNISDIYCRSPWTDRIVEWKNICTERRFVRRVSMSLKRVLILYGNSALSVLCQLWGNLNNIKWRDVQIKSPLWVRMSYVRPL